MICLLLGVGRGLLQGSSLFGSMKPVTPGIAPLPLFTQDTRILAGKYLAPKLSCLLSLCLGRDCRHTSLFTRLRVLLVGDLGD